MTLDRAYGRPDLGVEQRLGVRRRDMTEALRDEAFPFGSGPFFVIKADCEGDDCQEVLVADSEDLLEPLLERGNRFRVRLEKDPQLAEAKNRFEALGGGGVIA